MAVRRLETGTRAVYFAAIKASLGWMGRAEDEDMTALLQIPGVARPQSICSAADAGGGLEHHRGRICGRPVWGPRLGGRAQQRVGGHV